MHRFARLCLLALIGGWAGSCATAPPPPPPPPPVAAAPALPTQPIAKAEYLRSWVDVQVKEVFVGAPMFRSVLHWMAALRVHNRGNRTINRMELRYSFQETGHQADVTALDVFEEAAPLEPGETRDFLSPTAQVEYGVRGPIDPSAVDKIPPPTISVRVLDLTFADEAR